MEDFCAADPTLTFLSALFDLHEFILHRSDFHELHETSKAALKATVRMVVDVARSFNQQASMNNVEVLPPRCSHLARAGQLLLIFADDVTYDGAQSSLNEIKIMLQCLNRRWRMAGN